MRKITALFLSFVMVAMLLPLNAWAAEIEHSTHEHGTSVNGYDAQIFSTEAYASMTISSASIEAGGTGNVSVGISDNDGITAVQFTLKYDSDLLEIVSFTAGKNFTGASVNANIDGTVVFVWDAIKSVSGAQEFINIEFRAKSGAKAQQTVIETDETKELLLGDGNYKSVEFKAGRGTVDIISGGEESEQELEIGKNSLSIGAGQQVSVAYVFIPSEDGVFDIDVTGLVMDSPYEGATDVSDRLEDYLGRVVSIFVGNNLHGGPIEVKANEPVYITLYQDRTYSNSGYAWEVALDVLFEASETEEAVLTISSVSIKAGETGSVSVGISDNDGITAAQFTLKYDSDLLEVVSFTTGKNFTGATVNSGIEGKVIFAWEAIESVSGAQEFINIEFRAKSGAKTQQTIIETDAAQLILSDSNYKPVEIKGAEGTVDIVNAGGEESEEGATLTIGSANILSGSTGNVSVTISENEGICVAQFILKYDPDLLEVVSCKAGSNFSSAALINTNVPGMIIFVWDSLNNIEDESEMLNIEFRVKDGTEPQETFVELDESETFILGNYETANIDIKIKSGKIKIVDDPCEVNGHTEVIDKAVEPTCTETGLTEGKHCSVCGKVLVAQSVVKATGHSFGEWKVTKEATCEAKGIERRDCENCDHYETREIKATGHTEVIDKALEPTCTETGLTEGKHCSVCGKVIVAQSVVKATGHSFGEWKVTKEATCEAKGIERRDCENCDQYETRDIKATGHTEAIDKAVEATCTETGLTEGKHCSVCGKVIVAQSIVKATGHNFGEWEVTKEATCEAKGIERRDCDNCDHYETREIKATGHTEVIDKAVAPTCTETGLTEGKHCSVCGKVIVAQAVVKATGHSFGEWKVTKAATCEAKGIERRDCENCDHYETRDIKATGHTEVVDKAVEPTCTETGLTEGKHCSVCGEILVAQTVVKASGHSFGEWEVTKAATCEAKGEERRDCENCDHYETREIRATGHTEVIDKEVEPTCTETGLTEGKHCSVCGKVIVAQTVVKATGHSFGEWKVTKEATCEAKGIERRDCANCDHYETREIKATGHTEVIDKAVEPTCTETGLTEGKHCSVCGKVIVAQNIVAAKGHKDENKDFICDVCGEDLCTDHKKETIPAVAPTCTETGLTAGTKCSICGEILVEQTVVPAKGHSYKSVITKPACTEQGYTTHTCSLCGDSYIDSYVDATGHSFGEWKVTKEATCEAKGIERRDCDNCDHYETREVAAKGHDYKAVVTKPTCEEQGYTTHTCSVCGDSYMDSYVDAIGHDYKAVVTEPTCTEQGYTTHACSLCGESYVDSYVNATGHSFGEWEVTKAATCEAKGIECRDCANCDHYETREVAAKGHDYKAVVTEPTCTEQGYTAHTCSVCGDSYIDSYVDATGHSFGEWYETKAPTAAEKGEERRDCANCDYYEVREIEATGEETKIIYGDINGDGRVNVLDANVVRKCAAKMIVPTEEQFIAGDVNGDGKLNVLDANVIRKFAAKIITIFPVEQKFV